MAAPTREWLAAQYQAGRFDLPNAHHHALRETEHNALVNKFNNATSDQARLDRSTLIGLIQSQLPPGLPPVFVDSVYRILAYHSTAPFYPPPSNPLPQSLSLVDAQRGLAWLLPGRHLLMAERGNFGRTRSPADERRLLFQSLATRRVAVPGRPGAEAARRRHARANAHDVEPLRKQRDGLSKAEIDDLAADVGARANRDDDGDELYHDLVDVLHKNVPENPPYANRRDDLRPLAKELRPDFGFHTLAIARDELTGFVRALTALQFETVQNAKEPVDFAPFDEAAATAMAAFACDDADLAAAFPAGADLVAWPAFDQALRRIPRLLGPVYRLLIDVLLDGDAGDVDIHMSHEIPRELQDKSQKNPEEHRVLTLGRMALVHAIFPPCIDYETLRTVVRWRRSTGTASAEDTPSLPSSDAIWEHIQPRAIVKDEEPRASILAFSGRVQGTDEQFLGGVLSSTDYDGDDGRELMYSLYPFQIAPGAQYAKLLGQEWRQDGRLVFGDTVTSGLRFEKGVIEFKLSALGEPRVIEVDALEVWHDGE